MVEKNEFVLFPLFAMIDGRLLVVVENRLKFAVGDEK